MQCDDEEMLFCLLIFNAILSHYCYLLLSHQGCCTCTWYLCTRLKLKVIAYYKKQQTVTGLKKRATFHQLLRPHASPGTVAYLAKTSFWPGPQASPVYLYSTLCDCQARVEVSVLYWFEFYHCQTAIDIIQWRNFNKNVCTNYNWIYLLKIKHNYNLYKTSILIKKFLYKFRIILFENAQTC